MLHQKAMLVISSHVHEHIKKHGLQLEGDRFFFFFLTLLFLSYNMFLGRVPHRLLYDRATSLTIMYRQMDLSLFYSNKNCIM